MNSQGTWGKLKSGAGWISLNDKYVKKVELVYLTDVFEAYFMPYYKFYVELPEEKEVTDSKGDIEMKTYGAYYVPAFESRYISNMPVYDGTFN